MKIRSLLLGSAAAAGLATGAYAADPLTLTALDTCDSLGKTGITISSDTDCVQLSGEVKYEFNWGDYKGTNLVTTVANPGDAAGTAVNIIDNDADGALNLDWDSKLEWNIKLVATANSDGGPVAATIKIKEVQQATIRNETNGAANVFLNAAFLPDETPIATLGASEGGVNGTVGDNDDPFFHPGADGLVGTADDIQLTRAAAGGITTALGVAAVGGAAGTATFVVAQTPGLDGIPFTRDDVIQQAGADLLPGTADDTFTTRAAALDDYASTGGDQTAGIVLDEAYVSIGDGTVIMMGKKGSIINKGDDEPFNYLGLFNSDKVDKGVYWSQPAATKIADGGHVIQIVSDLGNGVTAGIGAENLNVAGAMAGTLVGVLAYTGEGISAHITGVAGGFLDGTIERFAVHAGFTGTFDVIKVRAAVAADNSGFFNALASAEATFDMFKLAISGEAATGGDFGVGASVTATVTDGVTVAVGGRFYNDGAGPDGYQVAAQVAAMVTETIKLTAEGGIYGNNAGLNVPYVSAEAAYAPGGNAAASIKGEFYANGGFKGTVKGSKSF